MTDSMMNFRTSWRRPLTRISWREMDRLCRRAPDGRWRLALIPAPAMAEAYRSPGATQRLNRDRDWESAGRHRGGCAFRSCRKRAATSRHSLEAAADVLERALNTGVDPRSCLHSVAFDALPSKSSSEGASA